MSARYLIKIRKSEDCGTVHAAEINRLTPSHLYQVRILCLPKFSATINGTLTVGGSHGQR